MKKLILISAMMCAGQLYGMETQNPGSWDLLPKELQVLIIQALKTGKDLDATIKAVQAVSKTSKALNAQVNNLKEFTALVGVLAEQFPDMSREEIAAEFNIPIARKYIELNATLFDELTRDIRCSKKRMEIIQRFIKKIKEQDADPNYTQKIIFYSSVVWLSALDAVASEVINSGGSKEALEALQFILDRGANPNVRSGAIGNLLDNKKENQAYGPDFGVYDLLKKYADK